jgi:tetratricopeptide (TPR) repeat protein
VLAQKSDKVKKQRKKKGLTDDDFRTEPIPLPPVGARREELDSKAKPDALPGTDSKAGTESTVDGALASPGGLSLPGASVASPFALDPSGVSAGAGSLLGPGRAQSVAAPLRRALVRAGYTDVLAVAPGNVALARAIEAHSLSPRVIETARVGLAKMALAPAPAAPANSDATPVPANTNGENEAASAATGAVTAPATSAAVPAVDKRWANLYQAAARVGQAVGYRAVVVLGVAPREGAGNGATYAMAVVDAARETGEPIAFDEEGATPAVANENAAVTAAALVSRALNGMAPVANTEKSERSTSYMSWARAAYEAKDYESAQDYLAQVLAFEPTRADARLMMADVLSQSNPEAAARAYRSALTLEGVDGPSWAKAAIAFTVGDNPSWPQSLAAARKALDLGYDSSELRQAMATAQMGRAYLFRDAGQEDNADKADADAELHLRRALELSPDDPGPARQMATYMVAQGRYRDAIRMLDVIAAQYPDDVDLQTTYANALFGLGGRDEDTFAAWARVWKLSGEAAAPVDGAHYKRLSEGFDQRISTLGKRADQLASSVAAGTSPRETALLQMTRYKEDMDASIAAVRIMQPSYDAQIPRTHASRVFAADLMSQAMAAYSTYLETGQEQMRTRAKALQRQSIMMLNAARTAP